MRLLLIPLLVAMAMPVLVAFQRRDIWHRLLAFASLSAKVAVVMLVVSVIRDDWMIGMVGVIMLSVGNAAVMLLANLLQRLEMIQ